MSDKQVVFRPEARDEMGEAFDWYEERRSALGHDFLRCVSDVIDSIVGLPEAFPRVHGESRLPEGRRAA